MAVMWRIRVCSTSLYVIIVGSGVYRSSRQRQPTAAPGFILNSNLDQSASGAHALTAFIIHTLSDK